MLNGYGAAGTSTGNIRAALSASLVGIALLNHDPHQWAVQAQVLPDTTLPQNSTLTQTGPVVEIGGGTRAGANLFHSFSQFSVAAGETIRFRPVFEVEHVFARVTGPESSQIGGQIQVDTAANLFLLNPRGIVFGPEATLKVGGSFVASTADQITFADGLQFGVTAAQAFGEVTPLSAPLLSIRTPVGLQFGDRPAPIQVLGSGNNLALDPVTGQIFRDARPSGLAVQPGRTLALLGGALELNGGNLTAESGRVVLGGIGEVGVVTLTPDSLGFSLDFSQVPRFQDIQFSTAASADVSGRDFNGVSGGELSVFGRQIDLLEGSTLLAGTLGSGQGQGINLVASEGTRLAGVVSDDGTGEPLFFSSIAAEVVAGVAGRGGSIRLTTPRLQLEEGAAISTSTYGLGNAGDLTVDAQQIELLGANPLGPSALGSVVGFDASGQGGNLRIVTEELVGLEGGSLSTFAFGAGEAGDIEVEANRIALDGGSSLVGPSGFFAGSFLGEGGEIRLNTQTLDVVNGAQITASAFGPGAGGEVDITAEAIRLAGSATTGDPSGIFTSVETPEATGQAGDITLSIGTLNVQTGARVAASTSGSGEGGRLRVQGDVIQLSGTGPSGRASGLFSTVEPSATGQAGNIVLEVERLEAIAGAQVVVGTAGAGDAGTLQVIAETVTLSGTSELGQSGVIASAIVGTGAGGDIEITANQVRVQDEATINASNFGTNPNIPPGQGAAGNVAVRADSLELSDGATVTTATAGGDRGNIDLQVALIALRRAAGISANALNEAAGGNITIDADFITAVRSENSDITANAQQAQGGQIQITAQGIFGTEFSDVLTPESDITASSEIGLNGTVEIIQLNPLEPVESADLSQGLGASEDQIIAGCPAQSEATFVASGRGGVPDGPQQSLEDSFVLNGLETEWPPSAEPAVSAFATGSPQQAEKPLLREAQTWQRNRRGEIELLAQGPGSGIPSARLNCLREVSS